MSPEEVAPLRFGPAVSPHLAARLAGRSDRPRERCSARAPRGGRTARATLIVEGVGGLLVPLARDLHACATSRVALGLPLLVAARPGLGTINHTLLTLEAARAAGLDVRAVVLTPWPAQPGAIERSNRETIARLGDGRGARTLGEICPDPSAELLAGAGATLPWRALARAARRQLQLTAASARRRPVGRAAARRCAEQARPARRRSAPAPAHPLCTEESTCIAVPARACELLAALRGALDARARAAPPRAAPPPPNRRSSNPRDPYDRIARAATSEALEPGTSRSAAAPAAKGPLDISCYYHDNGAAGSGLIDSSVALSAWTLRRVRSRRGACPGTVSCCARCPAGDAHAAPAAAPATRSRDHRSRARACELHRRAPATGFPSTTTPIRHTLAAGFELRASGRLRHRPTRRSTRRGRSRKPAPCSSAPPPSMEISKINPCHAQASRSTAPTPTTPSTAERLQNVGGLLVAGAAPPHDGHDAASTSRRASTSDQRGRGRSCAASSQDASPPRPTELQELRLRRVWRWNANWQTGARRRGGPAMTDRWSSTDDAPHTLAVLYAQELRTTAPGGHVRVPGQERASRRAAPDETIALPAGAGAIIYEEATPRRRKTGDGSTPQGATVYDAAPSRALVGEQRQRRTSQQLLHALRARRSRRAPVDPADDIRPGLLARRRAPCSRAKRAPASRPVARRSPRR